MFNTKYNNTSSMKKQFAFVIRDLYDFLPLCDRLARKREHDIIENFDLPLFSPPQIDF